MEASAFLMYAAAYFLLVGIAVGTAISRVNEKAAVPGASPWRMRTPKLFVAAGPVSLILFYGITMSGILCWALLPLLFWSFVAPWVGAVLIVNERGRRRAEDRATGIERPERLGI